MRLPSFSGLLAFDAVARHRTLTSAAMELNVSQPAVSRRIAALEVDLGCALFDRSTRPISMTDHGAELFDVLRSGLSRLELVVERIRNQSDKKIVSISAGSGFASYVLIPQLPELQDAFPKLAIRMISQSHSEDDMVGDLQVRFGDGRWPDIDSVKILDEEVFPACSPLFFDGRSPPLSMDELQSSLLLNLNMDRQPWYDWKTWFDAVGTPVQRRLRTLDFDSYALLINAALAGQGICLCWSGLFDKFLESGALVRLTDLSASSSRGYFITHRSDLPLESPIRDIAAWLVAAMRPVMPSASGSFHNLRA